MHFSKCFDYVVLTYLLGLWKSITLLFYLKYIVLYEQLNKTIPSFKESNLVDNI